MSSDPLSEVRKQPASARRRVEFRHPISESRYPSSTNQTSPTNATELSTPLEAAMALSAGYIATLHSGLVTFLSSLSQKCLEAYSDYHQNTAKNKEMHLNPHHIPTSVKKLKLTLQPLDEIKDSEGIKALQTELDAEIEVLHRKLRDKYIRPVEALNIEAYKRRFQFAVCRMLRQAAQVFIAQLDIKNYSEDKAIVDLLTSQQSNLLLSPLFPLEKSDLLQLYKEANINDITKLPLPTKHDDNYTTIIDKINTVTQSTTQTSEGPLRSIVTNNSQSPSSSMTSGSGNRTPTNRLNTSQSMGNHSTTQERRINTITPNTATGQDPFQLPPLSVPCRPDFSPPPTMHQDIRGTDVYPPPAMHQGIRGTDFVTGSTLAESLINNLASLTNHFSNDSERNDDENNNIDSSHDKELTQDDDAQYEEIDLEAVEMEANRQKLMDMLQHLCVNTIQLPIDKFHSTITQRDELLRIKRVTTSVLKSSLTAKVAAKIQAERPADRPVLSGLIREETEKNTSLLWSQLKSATDKLARVQQQQKVMFQEFQLKRLADNPKQKTKISKNNRGSNTDRVWTRTADTGSTVAAATSRPYPNSTTPSRPQHSQQPQQQWGRKRSFPPPQQTTQTSPIVGDNTQLQWGRKRSFPPPQQTTQISPTVGGNVSSAARRARSIKKRRPNNSQHNTESS